MAIKISGTTVIDDNRQFTNLNEGTVTGNSYVKLPVGTTADRPVSVANGSLRYNIDEATFEGYAAGEWGSLGGEAIAVIDTPVNTSPINNEANVEFIDTVFAATTMTHIYDLQPKAANWQVSNNISFSSTVLNANVISSSNTYTSNVNLGENNTYYWRVKYIDCDGNESPFSSPTQFTTKRDAPTTLGQAFQGGYYTGTIDIGGGVCYFLILSPNATGCCLRQWKTTRSATPGACSTVNGYLNTYTALNNATHPAGEFTATRTIGGYSDWYLPSKNELNVMYVNQGSMPGGEGYSPSGNYWSSTEGDAIQAWRQVMGPGAAGCSVKTGNYRARAIRRKRVT